VMPVSSISLNQPVRRRRVKNEISVPVRTEEQQEHEQNETKQRFLYNYANQ